MPMKLHPLPVEAERIIREKNAPPRLLAHLTLVHDVAVRLVNALLKKWPSLRVNRENVLLGAALHDIGKVIHPEELTGPGKRHEAAGEKLLLQLGVSADVARFARTHGERAAGLPLEDLIVKTADMVWKGTRNDSLEEALIKTITVQANNNPLHCFLFLDGLLMELSQCAQQRLEAQSLQFSYM